MTLWTTRAPVLTLACLLACGDSGKTSETSIGETSTTSTSTSGSTGSTTSTSAATDNSGSGSEGQTTSTSTTTTTTSATTSTSTGPETSSTTSTSTSESTGSTSGSSTSESSTTGGICVEEQGSCAMGEKCCEGLECCAGIPVPPGKEFCGVICPISDRNAKADFRAIDPHDVLRKVVALDITTWRYKKDGPDVRHLGPMAQDFRAAFGLGDTDKLIFPLDATGVSMAAIQALHQRLVAAEAMNDDLRARLDRLERRLGELEAK